MIYLVVGRSFPTILDFVVVWFGTLVYPTGFVTRGDINIGRVGFF